MEQDKSRASKKPDARGERIVRGVVWACACACVLTCCVDCGLYCVDCWIVATFTDMHTHAQVRDWAKKPRHKGWHNVWHKVLHKRHKRRPRVPLHYDTTAVLRHCYTTVH